MPDGEWKAKRTCPWCQEGIPYYRIEKGHGRGQVVFRTNPNISQSECPKCGACGPAVSVEVEDLCTLNPTKALKAWDMSGERADLIDQMCNETHFLNELAHDLEGLHVSGIAGRCRTRAHEIRKALEGLA